MGSRINDVNESVKSKAPLFVIALLIYLLASLLNKNFRIHIFNKSNPLVLSTSPLPPNKFKAAKNKDDNGSVVVSERKIVGSKVNIAEELTQSDLYCKIRNLELGIPLDSKVKMVSYHYKIDEGNQGYIAWIDSDRCPSGFYSKVRIDGLGNLIDFIDCRRTSREELALQSGMQGEIKNAYASPNTFNLAISGEGFFIEQCREEFNYVRSGEFLIATDGTVMAKSGCLILDESGDPLTVTDENDMNESGCNSKGNCIAIALPRDNDIQVTDKNKFRAITSPQQVLVQKRSLFRNAYEDLNDPEFGPFGPSFSKLPFLNLPNECKL